MKIESDGQMKLIKSWIVKKTNWWEGPQPTTIPYILGNGTYVVIVHSSVMIMKEESCLGERSFAKIYKCWIKGAINVCSNVQYVCKEPKCE
jgi:hypothetical protein